MVTSGTLGDRCHLSYSVSSVSRRSLTSSERVLVCVTGSHVRPQNGSRLLSFCGGRWMDLAPDFDEFIASLIAHGVEFVIVGAYALAFHGAPRFTGDLDILVQPTVDNAKHLLAALESFGFPVAELSPEAGTDRRRRWQMGAPAVRIDVMSAISGVEGPEVWVDRVEGPFGRHTVAFLGRETFLRNKRAAARPKDLADIDALGTGQDG